MITPLVEQIMQIVQALPEEEQRKVLDFVEFMKARHQEAMSIETNDAPHSFLETAQETIGMGEGLGDLSTNPVYMKGYGQ